MVGGISLPVVDSESAPAAAHGPTPGLSIALGGGGRHWVPPAFALSDALAGMRRSTPSGGTPAAAGAARAAKRVRFASVLSSVLVPRPSQAARTLWAAVGAARLVERSRTFFTVAAAIVFVVLLAIGWRAVDNPVGAVPGAVLLRADGSLAPDLSGPAPSVNLDVAQRALVVAQRENASPAALVARLRLAQLRSPSTRCTLPWVPSDTALRGRGRELLEGFVWLRRQRRLAALALRARLAELSECAASLADLRDGDGAAADATVGLAASAAIGVLEGAARCYRDFTKEALDTAHGRLCGVPSRPRFMWWNWPCHLHDLICIGVSPALVAPVVPCDMANYATCSEPGTEKEQRRMFAMGYWEIGDTVVVAPLGARPKPNNPAKFRMVYDCTMGGLNDWVYRSRFPFPSFSDFTSDYYQGCWILKNDASDWFYHLNASEGGRRLFGVRCPDSGQLARYSVLPMGSTETPHTATVFMTEFIRELRKEAPFSARHYANPAKAERAASESLECADLPAFLRVAPDGGLAADARVFVDDAAIPARSPQQALEALMVSSRKARDLGLVLEFDKLVGPNQDLPVVGLGVDVTPSPLGGYRVYVPAAKRTKTANMLTRHRLRRCERSGWCTRRELCEVVGALNFLLPAAPAGSAKLRDMWDMIHLGVEDVATCDYDVWVRVNNAWRGGVRWWENLLRNARWTGTRVRRAGRHDVVHSWADASGTGYGCAVHALDGDGQELLTTCEGVFTGDDRGRHSTWKEMQGVVKTLEMLTADAAWAARVRGGVLRHHTDCESVAKCVIKRRARARALRQGVDRVLALATALDVEVVPVWVSGNAMMQQGCDSGSRSGGLGVFADDAPPAMSFVPAVDVRSMWTAALGHYLRLRFGTRYVAFEPRGWSLAALRRGDVAFAPPASLSRRCLVDLLDEVRCDEFRLGATVVVLGGAPADWHGLRKYFPVQERIAHGVLGLDDNEARALWILHRDPGLPPPVGGMQRLPVEAQVLRIDCATAGSVLDTVPVV